ncbi:MAG: element excision factor XisI family protein [Chloroflexota bacterium]|nr:element excision factor XisI family protein [Chloroflexota bacterium]
MDTFVQIVKEEVRKYAANGRGAGLRLFALLDDERRTYAVNAADHPVRKDVVGVMVMARIVGDVVVIEEDTTDKPLIDALLQRGIARDRIVLAYVGEPIPDAAAFAL